MIRDFIAKALLVICIPTILVFGDNLIEKLIIAVCIICIGLAGGMMASK